MPPAYYKELPKIALGDLTGYPRIYAIALALVAHTDSELEAETIRRFVHAFQKVSPLNIGELWALAITLRLVLVENLRRLAVLILADHEKRNLANQVTDEIFDCVHDKEKFQNLVSKLCSSDRKTNHDDCAYFAQLAKRLRDQEPEIWPALEFLEQHLARNNSSAEKVVHLSHQRQAANQVSVANIITSMRLLSSLNWREFFESLSLVDRILEKDPIYRQMDFLTRDRYRHVIEKIGKKTGDLETVIAKKVFSLAQESAVNFSSNKKLKKSDKKREHVGYYLIDRGITQLAGAFNYKVRNLVDLMQAHKNITYFGLIGIFLAAACVVPVYYAMQLGVSFSVIVGIGLLALIPSSELALSFTNFVLTHAIRPKNLPKLELSMGIPPEARTMVVIPCMLAGMQVIQDLLEKIEIHYLGNSDDHLFFALLTDFTDSTSESMSEDEALLKTAFDGIKMLNDKYGTKDGGKFFLFHRSRQWNDSEKVWMGWERKRGKLHEFNRLLRGDLTTSFNLVTAPATVLSTIRFVITLDADTQLPRDTARKLVGTILHPLNQPVFDTEVRRVTEGYGVLQPRIGISLESSSRSHFSNIFSGYTGIDPYTTAVSEVYQDLFHEGSYTGKGLYDVDVFEAALKNRIPENTVLSHDLFEGLFARTALLTDIELLDDYPQSYRTFFTRQHRWTRGDWQIAAWILPFVRNGENKWVRNGLPLISRWKILDNLRRSLVAPAIFLWFILAWAVLPGSSPIWTAYMLALIIFPSLAQAGTRAKINALQLLFYILFLAHQAVIQTDAIVRIFYRKFISKNKLLEWSTAAQVETQTCGAGRPFWQNCWATESLLIAAALLLVIIRSRAEVLPFAFIVLWMCYPLMAHFISYRLVRKNIPLDIDGKLFMRQIARRTWRYFEIFVGPDDNWLPPDNHQVFPRPVTARRTSPTNMGDVEKCPGCSGRMRIIAAILVNKVVVKILAHMHLPTEPPRLTPARGPPIFQGIRLVASARTTHKLLHDSACCRLEC